MVEIKELTKSYHGRTVVDRLSFEVKEKEVFALLGSNGAGKTTTIKMILGLVKASEGSIEVKRNVKIGYSPETPYFPPYLSGREVMEYYGALSGLTKTQQRQEAGRLLALTGLDEQSTKVKYYSKGMLQRLALAQALLGDPDLLILDEPCAGLDAMGRVEVLQIIKGLKEQGKTVILNSHILSDIERVCNRGIIMGKGKKLRTWNHEELQKNITLEQIFVDTIKTS